MSYEGDITEVPTTRESRSVQTDGGLERIRYAVQRLDALYLDVTKGESMRTDAKLVDASAKQPEAPARSLELLLQDLPKDLMAEAEKIQEITANLRKVLL